MKINSVTIQSECYKREYTLRRVNSSVVLEDMYGIVGRVSREAVTHDYAEAHAFYTDVFFLLTERCGTQAELSELQQLVKAVAHD